MRKINFINLALLSTLTVNLLAQNPIQNKRSRGLNGINQFDIAKDSVSSNFDGIKIQVGGDFALQFQAINHTNSTIDTLITLGKNFNLPTANLRLDVQLADGVRMNMVTYLSSRHHPEAWVKGGYIQVDKLDFIREGFCNALMQHVSIKAGLDEINYGDVHFRRSDNARAIYNPFVGNYLMDGFSTEVFTEVYYLNSGFMVMGAVSNGNLNQSVAIADKELKPSFYGKLGFDKQMNDDFRLRLTGSFYHSSSYDNGQYLYKGDRTGSRYYNVMQLKGSSNDFRSGRFSPGFNKFTSVQMNTFLKFKGAELFGIYELVNGDISEAINGGSYKQIAAEFLYRIGEKEKYYLGGRYNVVKGYNDSSSQEKSIDRINIGGGWFLTNEVMVKAEYVIQNYSGDGWQASKFEGGSFKGIVVEAAIGF